MKNSPKHIPPKAAEAGPRFSKERLLTFRRYAARRDLLEVLLEDGRMYTTAEADAAMNTFLNKKGMVN